MASGAEGHRVLVQSDQHLEGADWDLPRGLPPHDVAVFAGDVSAPVATSVETIARWRDGGHGLAREVVFVPGNHEFYDHDHDDSLERGRVRARELGVRLLDGDEAMIDGVTYLGATLWTDYELSGNRTLAMLAALGSMNDHRFIRDGDGPFLPYRALELHVARRAWLGRRLQAPRTGPVVVVTHHSPSPSSIDRRWRGDPVNPAFCSDLDRMIHDVGPDLWIHGHTHTSFDYVLGRTRVVCNPKGYGPGPGRETVENEAGFDPFLIVVVPRG